MRVRVQNLFHDYGHLNTHKLVSTNKLKNLSPEYDCFESRSRTKSINNKTISFKGNIISNYPDEDIDLIKKTIGNCVYKKDLSSLLDPETDFRVEYDEDHVKLVNYDYPPEKEQEPVQGVCHELVYHKGKELQKLLGDRYDFNAVSGICPKYFSNKNCVHIFILARPKPKDSKHLPDLENLIELGFDEVLEDYLIIDPAFGVVNTVKNLKGYKISDLYYNFAQDNLVLEKKSRNLEFEELNDAPGVKQTGKLPLGYLKDLFPENSTYHFKPDDKSLVYFSFIDIDNDNSPPEFILSVQDNESEKSTHEFFGWRRCLSLLPDRNFLKIFVQKIDEFLQ